MSTTIQLPIPIFESGLPLSVADLNNMFNYADEGERHTRICLIGAGIIYGLNISVDTGLNISISAGAGVTSQGYLYCQEKSKTFLKFKWVGGKKETSNYSSANLTNTNVWMDGDVATLNKKPEDPTPFNFSEVAELADDGDNILNREALNDRILVVVFERVRVKRNGCTTCNKGSNGQVYTRFLLLKKAEWDRLLKCDLLNVQTSQLTVQFPYLQRFGLVDNCANFFIYDSSIALNGQYQRVVASAVETLMPCLTDMVDAYAPILKRNKAEDKVIISNGVSTVLNTKASKQYSYDYIKHIIQAYSELTENPLVQYIAQLPPESCFPKYLTLAQLVGSTQINTQNPFGQIAVQTEGVRLPFFTPPFEDASRTFQEAKFLYERIIAMLSPENLLFERGSTQENNPTDIRITPSRVFFDPLSMRSHFNDFN